MKTPISISLFIRSLKPVFVTILSVLLLYFVFILAKPSHYSHSRGAFTFPYDLSQSSKTIQLPAELSEISGLTHFTGDSILCLNDEEGVVYLINWRAGIIADFQTFGNKGDYEGLASANKEVAVLRSDGVLKLFRWKEDQITTLNYGLPDKINAEGLCWLANKNCWLVAAKGQSAGFHNLKYKKAVFKIPADNGSYDPNPVYTVDITELEKFLKLNNVAKITRKILHFLDPVSGNSILRPSGLAIHPYSGNLYILSANRPSILVLDHEDGEILKYISLNPHQHPQPEGICFLPNGNLLIADEGKGGKGKISEYSLRPQDKPSISAPQKQVQKPAPQ